MECNSSTAASSSSSTSPFIGFVIKSTIFTTTQVTGLNSIVKKRSGFAKANANRVAFFFAVIFGIVSPKIITKIVNVSVDIHVYFSPNVVITRIEPKAEAAIFTRLLPTNIVDNTSSKFSVIFTAIRAESLPSSSAFSSLILLQEERDISLAEKNAEKTTHTAIAITRIVIYVFILFPPFLLQALLISIVKYDCLSSFAQKPKYLRIQKNLPLLESLGSFQKPIH